jgi:hypothetical protein
VLSSFLTAFSDAKLVSALRRKPIGETFRLSARLELAVFGIHVVAKLMK